MNPLGVSLFNLDCWSSYLGEWPIYPYAVEEVIRDSRSHFYAERGCSYLLVALMLEGELIYRCDNGPESLIGPGEVQVIPVNSNYSFRIRRPGRYHKLVLEVKGHLLSAWSEALRLNLPLGLRPPSSAKLEAKIRDMGALLRGGREADIPTLLSKLHGFLVELSLIARAAPKGEQSLLARAKSMLESNSAGKLDIPSLAEELGICHSTLNKLFRELAGVSPQQYRIRCRMEEAKSLLGNTSLPVKEVAFRLGYVNQLYFSNDFKKNCGMSPKAHRRS